MSTLRSAAERKTDALATLDRNGDAWLATAGDDGRPQLIAVSTWWDGSDVIIATRSGSRTARNLLRSKNGRLAFGATDDVLAVDVELAATAAAAEGAEMAEGFVAANGWDPKDEGDDWAYYRLRPTSVQAYRGYEELEGRQVMRKGRWLA